MVPILRNLQIVIVLFLLGLCSVSGLSSCVKPSLADTFIEYQLDADVLSIIVRSKLDGWLGIGFHNGICQINSGNSCMAGTNFAIANNNVVEGRSRSGSNGQPQTDAAVKFETSSVTKADGIITMSFTRKLNDGTFTIPNNQAITVLVAGGDGTFQYHGATRGFVNINFSQIVNDPDCTQESLTTETTDETSTSPANTSSSTDNSESTQDETESEDNSANTRFSTVFALAVLVCLALAI